MSDFKRISMALSNIDKASHSAFKKLLNKSSSNSYMHSTQGSSTSVKKNYDYDYAKKQNSQFHNHYNLPFNLTGDRFAWQTNLVEREILEKICKENKTWRTNQEKQNKKHVSTSLDPERFPLHQERTGKRINHSITYKPTSSVINVKEKMKEPEPEICPLKAYVKRYGKPGIRNLLKKTPKDTFVYTKRRIIPEHKSNDPKPRFKLNKTNNVFNSHLKGAGVFTNEQTAEGLLSFDKENQKVYDRRTNRNIRNLTSFENAFNFDVKKLKGKHAYYDEKEGGKKKLVRFQSSENIRDAFTYKTARMKDYDQYLDDSVREVKNKEMKYKKNKNSNEEVNHRPMHKRVNSCSNLKNQSSVIFG